MREFVWIAFFSLIFATVIYFANSFFIANFIAGLGLSQRDLLFFEGLLLMVFGCFFLVVEGSRGHVVRWRTGVASHWLMRSKLTPDIIRVTVVLISTGVTLIVLYLL